VVLSAFDGRGYSVVEDGSDTRVADAIVISSDPPDGPVNVWVPTSALGDDGYPTEP
jgi:hypothetical protein